MRNGRLVSSKKIDFFKAIALAALFAAGITTASAQTANQAWLDRGIWHGSEPTRFLVTSLDQSLMAQTATK